MSQTRESNLKRSILLKTQEGATLLKDHDLKTEKWIFREEATADDTIIEDTMLVEMIREVATTAEMTHEVATAAEMTQEVVTAAETTHEVATDAETIHEAVETTRRAEEIYDSHEVVKQLPEPSPQSPKHSPSTHQCKTLKNLTMNFDYLTKKTVINDILTRNQ